MPLTGRHPVDAHLIWTWFSSPGPPSALRFVQGHGPKAVGTSAKLPSVKLRAKIQGCGGPHFRYGHLRWGGPFGEGPLGR